VKPRRLGALGTAWGRYLSGRPGSAEPAEAVPPVLARLGFDARVEHDRVKLVGCPCPLVAPDHPELVCRLADGVVDGVLSAHGSRLCVGKATHRPSERVCELELTTGGRST
jgi:hypothetical protein